MINKLPRQPLLLILGLAGALALRWLLIPLKGYVWDLGIFRYWSWVGFREGIAQLCTDQYYDYPPLSSWFFLGLGGLGWMLGLLGTPGMDSLIKLMANLADLGIGYGIYYSLRSSSPRLGILAGYSYWFNPGVIFNSAIWGQLDSLYMLPLIWGFIFIPRKPILGTILTTSSVLIKPQALSLAIALGIYSIIKYKFRCLILGLAALGTMALIILPIGLDPIWLIQRSYLEGYQKYPYLSLNAFNLWGMLGFWVGDELRLGFLPLSCQQLGWILFAGVVFLAGWILIKIRIQAGLNYAGYLLGLGFFGLLTRMHERYLFPVFGLLGLCFELGARIWISYWILSICYLVNLSAVLYHMLNAHSELVLDWAPGYFELSSRIIPPIILGILACSVYMGISWASCKFKARSSELSFRLIQAGKNHQI